MQREGTYAEMGKYVHNMLKVHTIEKTTLDSVNESAKQEMLTVLRTRLRKIVQ